MFSNCKTTQRKLEEHERQIVQNENYVIWIFSSSKFLIVQVTSNLKVYALLFFNYTWNPYIDKVTIRKTDSSEKTK